jgi:hypothetical protein
MEIPIDSMTTAEKLVAMEQLWTSLQVQPDHVPPEWHSKVLAERQRKLDSAEVAFSTLDEVRERIGKQRK